MTDGAPESKLSTPEPRAGTLGADNPFLMLPMPTLFVRNALPIITIMMMNGLMTVIDAIFVGAYVGADALAAVTLMFPIFMMMVALASVVGTGSASVLARLLGASQHDEACRVFTNSHLLALLLSLLLILIFGMTGHAIAQWSANGHDDIANMGWTYMVILVAASPLQFILSLNGDALRSEGHAGMMALMGAIVTVANIALTYWLVAQAGIGVAGSALGTVLAQLLGLAAVVVFRHQRNTVLRLQRPTRSAWARHTRSVLALGIPPGLNFLGVALASAVTIHALRIWQTDHYAVTAAAYGVVTRIQTFAFLPLLGLGMATQAIVGNNAGAGAWSRVQSSLRTSAFIALAYGIVIQVILFMAARPLGALFVEDESVIGEVVRIVPLVFAVYFAAGPTMILGGYFQAIGDAGRAAILGLARVYVFVLPLTYLLPLAFGEIGIWLAIPVASVAMVIVSAVILAGFRRQSNSGANREWLV